MSVPKTFVRRAVTLIGLSTAAMCYGDTLTIASSTATTNNSGSATVSLASDPDPLWVGALPNSSWISYTTSGNPNGAGFVSPPNGTDVTFTDSFSIPGTPTGAMLEVYADDTAKVTVNGTVIEDYASPVGNPYITCSGLPIGCTPTAEGTFDLSSYLVSGMNIITFDVLQTHQVAFGLDYAGTIMYTPSSSATPEPATLLLMGAPLVAFSLLRRRRQNKQ